MLSETLCEDLDDTRSTACSLRRLDELRPHRSSHRVRALRRESTASHAASGLKFPPATGERRLVVVAAWSPEPISRQRVATVRVTVPATGDLRVVLRTERPLGDRDRRRTCLLRQRRSSARDNVDVRVAQEAIQRCAVRRPRRAASRRRSFVVEGVDELGFSISYTLGISL